MSDIGIQEQEYLFRQYYYHMPHGKERIEAIRHAIKRADESGFHDWRIRHRSNLRREILTCGDNTELLPLDVEIISIFEEHPITKKGYVEEYLYSFLNALGQWYYFPQLPLEERKKIADKFFIACKQYHANLKDYYSREYYQYICEGKKEEAKLCQKKELELLFQKTPIMVSNCEACKQYRRVYHARENNNWKKAEKLAQPLLNGSLTCRQHPKLTIESLFYFAFDSTDWENFEHYAKLLEELPKPEWDEHDWTLMRYYDFTNLEKSLEIFLKELPYAMKLRDKWEQRGFYKEAYLFWTQYAKQHKSVLLELPEIFPLYQKDGAYNPTELADWFYKKELENAKQFDERNGYPYLQNSFYEDIENMKKLEQEKVKIFNKNQI